MSYCILLFLISTEKVLYICENIAVADEIIENIEEDIEIYFCLKKAKKVGGPINQMREKQGEYV